MKISNYCADHWETISDMAYILQLNSHIMLTLHECWMLPLKHFLLFSFLLLCFKNIKKSEITVPKI